MLFSKTVAGTVAVSADGRSINFVPDAPFAVGRNLTVFYSSRGILDLAGNQLTGSSFSFTTAFVGDTAAPHVVAVSPADGFVQVPINARVGVGFDEPIQATTAGQVTLLDHGVAVNTLRSFSNGNRTLTLAPADPLRENTVYTVMVGAVQDLAGNVLAAPVVTGFTTGLGADLARPEVVAADPASNAVGVARNVVVRVRFSERVNPLTVNGNSFQLLVRATGAALPGSVVTVAADGMSATLTNAGLAATTVYQIWLPGGLITDLAGQASSTFSSTFTTGAN